MVTKLVQPIVGKLSREARAVYDEHFALLLNPKTIVGSMGGAYELAREHMDYLGASKVISELTRAEDLLGRLSVVQNLIQLTDTMSIKEIVRRAPTLPDVLILAESFDPLTYSPPRESKMSRRAVIGSLTALVAAAAIGGVWYLTKQNEVGQSTPKQADVKDIKKSPSGKTLYEIVEPYLGRGTKLSDTDAKEVISLTSGRYAPIAYTFGGEGIEFRIWKPENAPANIKTVYEQTRGNSGQALVPSTTIADLLNRVVLRDDDNTIKSITTDFVKRNYGEKINPEDIFVERTGTNLLHDVKYEPNGKPKPTSFSTPTGHINFLRDHIIFVPYQAMKPN